MPKSLNVASGLLTSNTSSTTRYYNIIGRVSLVTGEADVNIPWRTAGVFSMLTVSISANSASGSFVYTLRKNTADATQTVTITSSSTGEFEDTTHTDTIVAGDKLCLKGVSPASGTLTVRYITTVFAPTSASITDSRIAVVGPQALNASVNHYFPMGGNLATAITSSTNSRQVIRVAGDFKYRAMYSNLAGNRAVQADCTLNGAIDPTTRTTLLSGVSGLTENTADTLTINSTDDVATHVVYGGGTTTRNLAFVAISFITASNYSMYSSADVNGNSINSDTTASMYLSGEASNSTTALVGMKARSTFNFSRLKIWISANSINSGTSTFTFMVAGVNATNTVNIGAGVTGEFVDTTHTDAVTASQEVNYVLDTSGTSGSMTYYSMGILAAEVTSTSYSRPITAATVTVNASSIARKKIAKRITISDSVTVNASSLVESRTRKPTETITVNASSLARDLTSRRAPTETVVLSSVITPKTMRYLIESITVNASSLARKYISNRAPSDSVVIGASSIKLSPARYISEEQVVVSPQTIHLLTNRTIEETVEQADSLSKKMIALRAPLEAEPAIEINEAIRPKTIRYLTEEQNVSDSIDIDQVLSRTMLDDVLYDTLDRMRLKTGRALFDEVELVPEDEITILKAITKQITEDAILIEDAIQRNLSRQFSAFEIVVNPSSLERKLTAIRDAVADTVEIDEDLHGAKTKFVDVLEEAVIVDPSTFVRDIISIRAPVESVTVTDLLAPLTGRFMVDDEISLDDSMTSMIANKRPLFETVELEDAIVSGGTYARVVEHDDVNLIDNLSATRIAGNVRRRFNQGKMLPDLGDGGRLFYPHYPETHEDNVDLDLDVE